MVRRLPYEGRKRRSTVDGLRARPRIPRHPICPRRYVRPEDGIATLPVSSNLSDATARGQMFSIVNQGVLDDMQSISIISLTSFY